MTADGRGLHEGARGTLALASAGAGAAVGPAVREPLGRRLARQFARHGERLERALGVTLRGQALIAAVALAVVVVTLGQLQEFAITANERDARALVARLGPAIEAAWTAQPAVAATDAARLDVWTRSAGLERLGDVGWIEDGRRLRRHGYLFAVESAPDGAPFVVAWPWDHGRSGLVAFAWHPGLGVLEHPNRAGRLSGPTAWPGAATPGWRHAR